MVTRAKGQQSGIIAGSVLAAARRTAGLTQEGFAEAIGSHADTVKSWESGRRSLGSVQAGQVARVRRRLLRLGAEPSLVARLDAAIDADDFTAQVISGDYGALASEVITRPWTGLVAWAVGQGPPAGLTAAQSAQAGLLPTADRKAFFESVRAAAETAGDGEASLLLRRQAYYLAAWDASPEGSTWLSDAAQGEFRRLRVGGRWTPEWPAVRSLSVARACQGDPYPLQRFIGSALDGEDLETANLVYWAYWIGAIAEPAADDRFMAERELNLQQASVLLHHLGFALAAAQPYAELTVHSALVMVNRWPQLLEADPALAEILSSGSERILDSASVPLPRQEVSAINLAARNAIAVTDSHKRGWPSAE
jgi:transcriptional regulator with XRE-family HTH domain